MKKILITILIMFASLMMANAKMVDEPYLETLQIDTLMISVPAEVKMFEGDSFDFRINIIDDELIKKHITYEIKNNCLHIKLDKTLNGGIETIDNKKIKISIMTPRNLNIITGNRNLTISSHPVKTMKKSNNENN